MYRLTLISPVKCSYDSSKIYHLSANTLKILLSFIVQRNLSKNITTKLEVGSGCWLDVRPLVVASDVLVASSAQIADPAVPQLVVAVLVDQELGQLIETLPALKTPEAAL